MNTYDKIRAGLDTAVEYVAAELNERIAGFAGHETTGNVEGVRTDLAEVREALAALSELEQAAAEPVAVVERHTGGFGQDYLYITSLGNLAKLTHEGAPLYAAPPPAPIAEPLFILTTGAIDSDGEQDDWDIECDSSRRLESFCAAHPGSTVALYAAPPAPVAPIASLNDRQRLEAIIEVLDRYLPPDAPLTEHEAMNEIIGLVDPLPPAPVAEIREVVVTDEVAKRVMFAYHHNPVREDNAAHGRDMIAAVRAELGPALGLVELKEPTPEECERIYSFWIGAEGCNGRTPGERMGRIMFDACRAVMCPKEGL